MAQYTPGVCNINTQEIDYRRKVGFGGVAVSGISFAFLLVLDAPLLFRVIIFLPLFIGILNLLQAHNSFCVMYGSSAQHNAEEGSQTAQTVEDKEAISADKRKSQQMMLQALLISVAITLVLMLAP